MSSRGLPDAPSEEADSKTRRLASADVVKGNTYDKFRTKNPIARRMQDGFLASARRLLGRIEDESGALGQVLEVGCGPGDLAHALAMSDGYVGTDLGFEEVAKARHLLPRRAFSAASAYELPFADDSFDVVLVCEVLEHLEEPEKALREIERVARGRLLLSVPWEPVWRALNLARGAYVGALGNTPGHLQHFSRSAFRTLVSRRFEIVAEERPLPWTMLLASIRSAA